MFDQDFNVSPVKGQVQVRTKNEPKVIKIWDNWKGFTRKCLLDRGWFKMSYSEKREKWEEVLSEVDKGSYYQKSEKEIKNVQKQEKSYKKPTRK